MRTRKLILCAIFTALIAVGAFIRIPFPVMPFTMQTMIVSLAGLTLGARAGAASCLIYFVMGLIGLPVFTSGGGIGALLTPTAGFLIGFIPGAFVTGKVIGNKKDFPHALIAAISGNVVTYIIALAYTYVMANFITGQGMTAGTLLVSYCAVFIPSDLAKMIAAAYVYTKLRKSGI